MGKLGEALVSGLSSSAGNIVTGITSSLGINSSENKARSDANKHWQHEFDESVRQYEDSKVYNALEASKQRDWQSEEAIAQRDWEAAQAALTREFNDFQAQKARDWQTSEREASQMYNSPVELMKRYSEAGLNPAVMMSGQSASVSSAPVTSAASASTPAGASAGGSSPASAHPSSLPGIAPIRGGIGVLPAMAQGIADGAVKFAQAYEAITKGDLTTAEKDRIKALLEGDVKAQELTNALLDLNMSWLPEEKQASITLLAKQAQLAAADKDLRMLEQATEKTKSILNESLAKLHGRQADEVKLRIDNYDKVLDLMSSEIKKNLASANESDSSARLNRAFAISQESINSIDAQLDKQGFRVSLKEFEHQVKIAEDEIHHNALLNHEYREYLESDAWKHDKYVLDQMKQSLENNDRTGWNYWKNLFFNTAGAISSTAIGAAGGIKAATIRSPWQ